MGTIHRFVHQVAFVMLPKLLPHSLANCLNAPICQNLLAHLASAEGVLHIDTVCRFGIDCVPQGLEDTGWASEVREGRGSTAARLVAVGAPAKKSQ